MIKPGTIDLETIDLETISGGCLCGAVRYHVQAAPVRTIKCHCRDCQRASGSVFAVIVSLRRDEVTLQGTLHSFAVTGDSGQVIERDFCPACGSQVAIRPARAPDIIGLHAGTLDDPAAFPPTVDAYTASAPSWDVMDPGTDKFDGHWSRPKP